MSMNFKDKMIRRFMCLCMSLVMLCATTYVDSTWAATETKKTDSKNKNSKKDNKPLYKEGSIYLDEALGFERYNALKTVKTYFDANWNEGLHYNGAIYHGLNSYKVGTNINYNFETNTQYKYRDAKGYGYNCTGVVTSVMYYASGTKKSIPEFYEDLINGKGIGRICNGFAWWDFFNRHNVKKYCAGRVSNNADVDRVLNKARDLQTGYVIYFSPTVRGGDCHLGFYWGTNSKGNHMMRHCIWRGFEWSKAFPGARGTYDLYLIPLSQKKNGVIEKTFNLKIKRKAKVKNVQSTNKKKSGKKKKAKKSYYSLKGDTYNFYGSRDKKGLHKKLVYKEKYTVTKKVVKKVKVKTKSKKTGKKKVKYKKKVKTVTQTKVRTILPLSLKKDGESYRTVEVKVKLIYKKGKLKNYYISSIDGKELSANRKNKKTFWIKEKKGSTSKAYKYKDTVYCIRAEKVKEKTNKKLKRNKKIAKINLCLYKNKIDKKNFVKKAKENRTLKINIK